MGANTLPAVGASGWASPISPRERVSGGTCIAPNASFQGTGLPFSGYAAAPSMALTAAPQHTTLAVRKDDARVPVPRGRER